MIAGSASGGAARRSFMSPKPSEPEAPMATIQGCQQTLRGLFSVKFLTYLLHRPDGMLARDSLAA